MNIYLTPEANNVAAERVDDKILATPLLSVRYDDGIFAYYEGAEYPQKGMSPVEVMRATNIIKALFIETLRLRPTLSHLLRGFNRIGNKILEQYFLKDEFRTANCRELESIIFFFLTPIVNDSTVATHFSKIFSHIIEYDNAYRLRFVDIASETTKERLIENPRKEIKRLLKIVEEREVAMGHHVSGKFKYVSILLRLFLLRPKYRNAFREAIAKSNWENMIWDNIDRYWASLRTDYDFFGMSYEARQANLKALNYSLPIQKEYEPRSN